MVEEKEWFKSKTIWGALLAVMASMLGTIGIPVDAVAQSELAEAIVQLVGALGAMVAVYGRLNATHVIE